MDILGMVKREYILAAILIAFALQGQPGQQKLNGNVFSIPAGPTVNVDGVISAGEWDGAAKVEIKVADNWIVNALLQHDDNNLYIAFTNLRHAGAERYPEILLDPGNQKLLLWQRGMWWLHASYNLCESNLAPDQYGDCAPSKPGWDGTRFPLKGGVSEIAISLGKAGLSAKSSFGIALDVTDTRDEWNFWPPAAKSNSPFSWQTAVLAGRQEPKVRH